MTKNEAIKKLTEISNDKERTQLQRDVAQSIIYHIEEYEEPKSFFKDFWVMGRKSEIITGLIYYEDTYKFFDKHSADILEMLNEEEELKIDWFSKNNLAWFGFERTLSDIQIELFERKNKNA